MDESNCFDNKCKVLENETLGRYVVAAAPIKEGETLLLEKPIIIVPLNGDKRCSNCFKLTDKNCSLCKAFPICPCCPAHNEYDCKMLCKIFSSKKNGLEALPDNIYGILKVLLLRENSETEGFFREMMTFEAHLKERKDTEIWQENKKKIIDPLLQLGCMECFKNSSEITEEYLQEICSIMDVNIFEVRAPDEASMRAFYVKASLLNHNCVSNTALAIDEQFRMKIYANRAIAEGEMITNCYINILLGTDERRQILQMGKYFHCACDRCQDPTELGSHMSSFICAKCAAANREDGFIVKQNDQWKCLKCDHILKNEYVQSLLERAKEEMFHAKDDIYHYELLMAKLSRILHRNHYLMVDIKQNVASILRSILQNMIQRPGRKVYERKIRLCQEVINVLKIVQPGISRLKGIALYELANTMAEMQRMRYSQEEIKENQLIAFLQHTELLLREAIRHLIYEPVGTPEGILTRTILKEIKDLQNDIKELEMKKANPNEMTITDITSTAHGVDQEEEEEAEEVSDDEENDEDDPEEE